LTWHLRRLRIRSSEARRSLFTLRCILVTYRRGHRLETGLVTITKSDVVFANSNDRWHKAHAVIVFLKTNKQSKEELPYKPDRRIFSMGRPLGKLINQLVHVANLPH
ncbi:MAG: hypothetical protein RL635_672, partial [Chloroflexota bacterium]